MQPPLVSGTPASPGIATGRARVYRDNPAGAELAAGDILVTVITDPLTFADMIEHAAALVTDRGGLASHPAILARELGIPCVVGTRTGTDVITDGMRIVVDGTAGTVHAAG
ncbi:PEP-utilizing enzyme [Actinocrispum sp. NPDC049592]|uniref:PEP-utilizing enzyme n=1 Tax=Actinocrispum sp. NPDC049592 TaxID=3154835 RepID=UPI0034351E57